jgi:hypothetical protein
MPGRVFHQPDWPGPGRWEALLGWQQVQTGEYRGKFRRRVLLFDLVLELANAMVFGRPERKGSTGQN